MKRADLTVGQIVEDKSGGIYRVVDTGEWRKFGGYRLDASGVEYEGVPVYTSARRTAGHRNTGVLIVAEHRLDAVIQGGVKTIGAQVTGEAKLPQHLYPAGHYNEVVKARRAAFEAKVEEDEKRDQDLLEQVRHYWGDKTDLILAGANVVPDDGLLMDRERQALVTIILCGVYR